MMKTLIIISTLTLSLNSFAESKKSHRHHEAHVHGAAELSLAFDQLNGKVDFKAASEGILGFEHEPKTEKDKKALQNAVEIFEKNISSIVQFESALGCVFTKDQITMAAETQDKANDKAEATHQGQHSNFVAQFSVACKKDIKGSKVTFDFKQFKRLKDIDVTVLVGDLQKSFEIKAQPKTIELK